ncbi:MAG: cytochrome b [gamma proteobacterium symbiont of Lucinoma myriamae]|nr:cytochrome b [gamma proteobacterium symbiont of Lucinoma myriamae]MCU7817748.1 cytochrome b [gamma proteobacterium symbiont of Lucinoma myriamae]MCU7831733.1 cytochrome b [gamma proteobacterium symbiont of Lucinoma myriamae]
MSWRNSNTTWGSLSRVIHWLSAITIISLFALGLWMVDLTYYDSWYRRTPHIHKSIGLLLFFITLFRLMWLWLTIKPAPLQEHTKIEQILAKVTHGILYLLLFSLMLSGYFISTADGRAIEVFNWFEVSAVFPGIEGQEDIAGKIHYTVAISLIVVVSVHALAAIKHHIIDKDNTLKRMLGLS